MHLFAGQVDAVGLLERRHDVTGITLVVEGKTGRGRGTAFSCGAFGCFFARLIKLDHVPVGIDDLLRVVQKTVWVFVKTPEGADRKTDGIISCLAAHIGVDQPDHGPEIRDDLVSMPPGGQLVQQQIRHGALRRSAVRMPPAAAWHQDHPAGHS